MTVKSIPYVMRDPVHARCHSLEFASFKQYTVLDLDGNIAGNLITEFKTPESVVDLNSLRSILETDPHPKKQCGC